ncbi:transglutaminase domain-containing protein [candidate division KSB1 bacterium]|nr:transglutaminase domain-containing protein [candidate division KSB1 bacterium]
MRWYFICIGLLFTTLCLAENYLINGGQDSQINYQMVQKVEPAAGTQKLVLSYVIPEDFSSPTYNQKIAGFNLNFSTPPSDKDEKRDNRGNKVIRATWKQPTSAITATISLRAINNTKLTTLNTSAPFPPKNIPDEVRIYLQSTKQVPADDGQIKNKAQQLVAGAKTQFDAVQKILIWIVDHMNYVLNPQSYEAMYSFRTGKGNCQNYSHLAAALMRSVGIPVRIVNGITTKQPYDVNTGSGILTMRMAQGRHSWIEVFFPDLGWVPFDPQQMQLFVSNRFIRVEVGLDNEETANDGLIRWTQSRGSSGQPRFEEVIEANFADDRVNLSAQKQNYGPQKLLFSPPVDATFTTIAVQPPPKPKPVSDQKLKTLQYRQPFIFGNLEFPENVDFANTRGPATQTEGGELEMRKNFMVETAEYVTTRGNQYAQTFILQKPILLTKAGLALHKFGGDGQLWMELFKDDGRGQPGEYITTSDFLPLDALKFSPGYTWVDFEFPGKTTLSPGRYWIALGFTGSPIVNWFFTYSKSVGPPDGTRYKTMFDETWSRSLAFEFNYRIQGLAAQ